MINLNLFSFLIKKVKYLYFQSPMFYSMSNLFVFAIT